MNKTLFAILIIFNIFLFSFLVSAQVSINSDNNITGVSIIRPPISILFSNASFNQTFGDTQWIRLDGTTTTTATIPFAEGFQIASNKLFETTSGFPILEHVSATNSLIIGGSFSNIQFNDPATFFTNLVTISGDDIFITSDGEIRFRDTALLIKSSADGVLDIVSDNRIDFTATTVNVNTVLTSDGLTNVGSFTQIGTSIFAGNVRQTSGTFTLDQLSTIGLVTNTAAGLIGTDALGSENEIPSVNVGQDGFDYSADFTFDGDSLKIVAPSTARTLILDSIDGNGATGIFFNDENSAEQWGILRFGTNSDGRFAIREESASGNPERFVIQKGGDTGIGVVAPVGKLHITSTNSGSTTDVLRLQNDATATGTAVAIRATVSTTDTFNSGSIIFTRGTGGASADIGFFTGATEALRIIGGAGNVNVTRNLTVAGDLGFYGVTAVPQSDAYSLLAAVVEDRELLASANADVTNNNNVLAALITDLQATGIIGISIIMGSIIG